MNPPSSEIKIQTLFLRAIAQVSGRWGSGHHQSRGADLSKAAGKSSDGWRAFMSVTKDHFQ